MDIIAKAKSGKSTRSRTQTRTMSTAERRKYLEYMKNGDYVSAAKMTHMKDSSYYSIPATEKQTNYWKAFKKGLSNKKQ